MPRPDVPPLDAAAVRAVLCDADGNLFPSEEPAFDASAGVTNDFLRHLGSDQRWAPDELRAVALGRNFRALASDLAGDLGVALPAADLEHWVRREQADVTRHLAETLRPDPRVTDALVLLSRRFSLAVVTSSALARVGACLDTTGLAELFPADTRFSAQDSLPAPTSKPDPAVYAVSLRTLGLAPGQAVAVEDAVAGVQSAVGAGIPTIGNLAFIPYDERPGRRGALAEAGAAVIAEDWDDVVRILCGDDPQRFISTREVSA